MKAKLLSLLLLISSQVLAQSNSLISIGSDEGLTIAKDAFVHADGLTISPTEDFSLTNTTLSRASNSTAKLSNQASRVYQFSKATPNFTGTLNFNYLDSELGSLTEKNLQLVIHDANKWYRQASNNNLNENFLNAGITNLGLSEISSFVFMPNLVIPLNSIVENSSLGTKISQLIGTDEDLANELFTYELVNGQGSSDNGRFTISGDELQTNSTVDYESKMAYSVRLRVTDQYNRSNEKVLLVSVKDINEAPTALAISKSNLYESNYVNQIVGLLGSTDQDEADSHTYSLVSGAGSTDNAAFNIVDNQIRASQVYAFDSKNNYSVRVRTTDRDGLSFDRVIPITISALPKLTGTGNLMATKIQVGASSNPKISKGFVSNLFVSGADIVSYTWLGSTNTLNSGAISNPIAQPAQTTTYSVLVTNSAGSSVTLSITVEVVEDFNITANNLLTANGDGENDVWTIGNLNSYPDNKVMILDRSGRVVYSKSNYENNWNGLYNGSDLPEDTYYYVITLNSGANVKKGFITIVK